MSSENDLGLTHLEQTFYTDIEELVVSSGCSHLDAIIHWCDEKNIEVEYIAPLITKDKTLLLKLQSEAENLNFLPKTVRLPI